MRQAIALGVTVAVSVATAWADTFRVTDDTNINLATPNQNNGANGSLLVRNVGSGGVRHGFLRFDLADLDPSRPIAHATLKLWVVTVENAGLVDVHPVLDPWNEATLTAGIVPQPGLGSAVASFALSTADGKHFVSVDVTALVRDWLDGTLDNHGIALLPSVVDNVRAELNAKENTGAGTAAEIEVLSAADVTSVQTGTGLEGGGSSGDLVVQLKDCVLGEVLKWDGAGWGCAIDSVGGGVTNVGSGPGLVGGPITTSGTLSLDTGFTDLRYSLLGHNHDASYLFKSGDTMTGTLSLPANALVAGTNQLVLSGGKVGIGTTSPSGLFHTQDNTLSFDFGGTPSYTRLGFVLEALSVGNVHQGAIRSFFTDTSLNPAEEGGRISFPLFDSRVPTEAMGIGFWTRTGGGPVTEQVRIDPDGHVGIGMTVPSQRLEVAGNLKISGGGNGLIFPDNTVQTTAATGDGGSVTSVGSGLGLIGGPITTSGSLSLDTGFTDSRYSLFGHNHDPNYVFKSGDTMTGALNLPANGLVAGTDQLVLSGGNVGIGTSPSNYRLHVKATAGPTQHLMAIQGGANGAINSGGISFLDAAGTPMGTIGDGSQGNSHIYLGAELGNLILYTGATNSLVIDTSQRVGIGTDLPAARLDVGGDVRSSGQFLSTVGSGTPPLSVASSTKVPNLNADWLDGLDSTAFASAGALSGFVTKGGDTMTGTLTLPANGLAAGGDQLALASGNVGVGTSSPSQKLEVVGNLQISGSGSGLKFPDGTTQSTAAAAPTSRTPAQIALLRWYDGIQSGADFAVGNNPQGIAFDGSHLWIANQVSGNITKLRASDGALVATYAIGGGSTPHDVAFDGANIWVTNHGASGVTKLRASDGTVLGTFSVGSTPIGLAFDGANVWATSFAGGIVRKIRASDGADLGSFGTGTQPWGVAFDGANIWVTNSGSGNVTKLRASDGANLGSFAVGPNPHGVAFDGANVWVANESSGNPSLSSVTKLRASDGANLGSFAVGSFPYALVFDGTHVWVAASGGVTKLRASDGASLGTFPAGGTRGMAFDGANIWVTNFSGNTVSKR